ncbi:hypothetical protein [Natronobiforma cellulositropha]|uniref:hypothetical protein n=1 Tax=Natronobiforma cellulositropha TaxID=1679076 RepID=UPI0021D5DEDC|nr:hypothetical protein [Natronobiforma cellulositropha]
MTDGDEVADENADESWTLEGWHPPRCPHCESVVVGTTATGPCTIQASCGCYLTQAEARALAWTPPEPAER